MLGGVPMATLLGVLTGILAFLPNIGAIISGVLIVLVGFSAGVNTGLYAVVVYLIVQTVDGYLIVPVVAKRAVDLAPALVLGAQILFGALFRSEEHTSELQSLMRISYAVFCLKKKKQILTSVA